MLPTTTTISAVAAAALLALPAVAYADSPVRENPPPTWNTREHEAHRPAPSPGPAGRAALTTACATALSQAWTDLGHFSDGMETWMLTTDTCRAGSESSSSSSSSSFNRWSPQAM